MLNESVSFWTKGDGTKDNYFYNITFSFNGIEGVNL